VPAREFATKQNPTCGRIEIKPNAEIPMLAAGTEIGGVWELGNPAANGGGPLFPGSTGNCPSSAWWTTCGAGSQDPDGRTIEGIVGSSTCFWTGQCPEAIALLVEDQTADGSDAGFISYSADNSQLCGLRYWDLARTDTAVPPGDTLHGMYAYPRVETTGSSGPPPNTILTSDYRDAGSGATKSVWIAGASGVLPASSILTSYDIVYFHGTADPGRERSLWTPLKSVPYADVAVVGDTISVPCPTDVDDTFVAVGLTFDGAVQSFYVGKSTQVECNPNLAVPDEPAKRPQLKQRQPLGRGR
jgi:hypothetical protein